jgi:hypothetical protein
MQVVRDDRLGTAMLGRGGESPAVRFQEWKRQLGERLPPEPTATRIPPAYTPAAPKLPANWGDDDTLTLMLATYRKALEALTGERCYAYLGGLPEQGSKARDGLTAAAAKLREHEVAPAPWVAFSLEVWREHVTAKGKGSKGGKGLPPVGYVFDAERIEAQRGWFRSREGDYCGQEVLMTTAHREVVRRWHAMREALVKAETLDAAETIVVGYTGGGDYDALVQEAVTIGTVLQDEMGRCVRAGGWVWGRR